jgi:hypothetical protein
MNKVIDMKTREEITQLPLTEAEGTAILNHLIAFEGTSAAQFELIKNLMKIAENNSGVNFFEFMWARAAK